MIKTKVKKIIPTSASRGHAEVDASIIWCFDPRFRRSLWDLEEAYGLHDDRVDVIKIPGGALSLAGKETDRNNTLNIVTTSVRLHSPKLIIAMLHMDCGANKPLLLAKGQTEEELLREKIKTIEKSLRSLNLPIEPVIVDFDRIMVL
jgi:hypothetical protein